MQRLVLKRKIIDRRIEAFGVWNVTRLAQVCSLVEVRSFLSTSHLPILASTRENADLKHSFQMQTFTSALIYTITIVGEFRIM